MGTDSKTKLAHGKTNSKGWVPSTDHEQSFHIYSCLQTLLQATQRTALGPNMPHVPIKGLDKNSDLNLQWLGEITFRTSFFLYVHNQVYKSV